MNARVPIYIQPVSSDTAHIPTHFNCAEYDTLASLNLPMNDTGVVLPQTCARIPLGYRIMIPRGCVGVMKERRSIVEETPFTVLSGFLDCNTIREDKELQSKQDPSWTNVKAIEQMDAASSIARHHPETVLYIYNCGTKPLEYTKGKSIVQLFVYYICESQLQILQVSDTSITAPLRYTI
jgi:hypothetical protein